MKCWTFQSETFCSRLVKLQNEYQTSNRNKLRQKKCTPLDRLSVFWYYVVLEHYKIILKYRQKYKVNKTLEKRKQKCSRMSYLLIRTDLVFRKVLRLSFPFVLVIPRLIQPHCLYISLLMQKVGLQVVDMQRSTEIKFNYCSQHISTQKQKVEGWLRSSNTFNTWEVIFFFTV